MTSSDDEDPRSARWVIYSTFDAQGRPASWAVEQLDSYAQAGFDTLVIDTSPEISAARRADWERCATRWLKRDNSGYDFGSFRYGLDVLRSSGDASRCDLLLTNDSCFGPFVSMKDLIAGFDARPKDRCRVFGITDSLQELHHIQSYWLYFRSDVVHHACAFFDSMIEASDREEAIRFGELALGAFLTERGCVFDVALPLAETVDRLSRPHGRLLSLLEFGIRRTLRRWKYNRDADTQCLRHLLRLRSKLHCFNPAVLFGVALLRRNEMPFIKRSLLRDNVYKEPAIPAGIDIARLDNVDVRGLLSRHRPV